MEITIQDFKNTTKAILDAIKHVDNIRIDLPHYVYGNSFKNLFSFAQVRFRNVAKLYRYVKSLPVNVNNASLGNARVHQNFWDTLRRTSTLEDRSLADIQKEQCGSFEGLRLVPEVLDKKYRPKLIHNTPPETTEGERTYRAITARDTANHEDQLVLLSADNDLIYDYLDRGYFLMFCEQSTIKGKLEKSIVVADRYDVNTAHIFAMCWLQPSLADILKNKCFINHREAEMMKLRMVKKLHASKKSEYAKITESIDTDYRNNSTLVMVSKLLDGSVAKTTINEIEFTKSTATYERIVVQHEELLNLLQTSLNFNSEFDIYSICSVMGAYMQSKSDSMIRPAAPEDRIALPELSINGIRLNVSVAGTGNRYINGIRVNKDEVGAAITRASCYHDTESYKVFLETIRALSIKHHDIIANGLPVKIHSNITLEEYRDASPGPAAPTIKFKIDKSSHRVHLEISPTRSVPVHFQKIINRVQTLNTRTDNSTYRQKLDGYFRSQHVTRNYRWAAKQMVDILVSACTFEEELVDDLGNKTKSTRVQITEGDVELLLDAANENKRAAIARSREFMEMAVKSTSAEKIDFMGQPAYKVVGKMRTYAVMIKSAKVYDFDTKKYRCIVNHNHYQGAGYDDVATRLLALKNDSLTQESIGTLMGEAQPQYENFNNDANSAEREAVAGEDVRAAISRAFSVA